MRHQGKTMSTIRHAIFAPLAFALSLAACGSPVGDFCSKARECYMKDCDFTNDACEAYASGREEACVADLNAELQATASGDSAVCERCIEATEEWLACAANTSSCAAFDDADNADGPCASELNNWGDACDNFEEICWQ